MNEPNEMETVTTIRLHQLLAGARPPTVVDLADATRDATQWLSSVDLPNPAPVVTTTTGAGSARKYSRRRDRDGAASRPRGGRNFVIRRPAGTKAFIWAA